MKGKTVERGDEVRGWIRAFQERDEGWTRVWGVAQAWSERTRSQRTTADGARHKQQRRAVTGSHKVGKRVRWMKEEREESRATGSKKCWEGCKK